ncbi:hypothetical protein MLD38_016663 [Melastoma candidum]|uniref:Uncharacterized protein n=1 Tax=Melastoma candidum TaxID=119954 RepID=A0ACB9QMF4_9MYRT|nr:hypothetical protein MLD38_016663 [Melastoma candidum]
MMRAISFSKLVNRLLVCAPCRRKSVSHKGRPEKPVASRGHFTVYTVDQIRYMVPITYLDHEAFRGMLDQSEEEFGLPGSGPIMLPCDAYFMEHLMLLIKRTAMDHEKTILLSK